MKKTVLLSIFAAVFVFAVSGADQSVPAGWKGTIATENGVRIIKNPEQPLYGEFAFDLQQELSIGGDPTKDDYYFPRGAVLGVGQKGELIVSDLQNSRVMVMTRRGNSSVRSGGRGRGPVNIRTPAPSPRTVPEICAFLGRGRRSGSTKTARS